MTRSYLFFTVLSAVVVTLLLTSCSPATGASAPGTATVVPTLKATNTATHTITTGQVQLRVNAQSYQANDTILVTLSNQSNQVIYFPDHLTNCSVILLLRLTAQPLASDSGQAGISPCKKATATIIHSLAAGQNLIVRLFAPSNGWVPGLYHATLTYSTLFKKPTMIYTTVFVLGPISPLP